jgi:beta-phosphoglucomutase
MPLKSPSLEKTQDDSKMSQENTFAVIFDMDGVLIDSTPHIKESFRRVAEEKGLYFDKKGYKSYSGHSILDQFAMWKEDYGVDLGDVTEFSEKAFKIQLELLGADVTTEEGLLTLLNELKTKRVPMGVGTSSGRKRAEAILSLLKITDFFSALVTADDIEEHKPNPHIFLEVARQLNTAPERCVVIEDAASGIEAAHRAQMRALGFLTKENSIERLSEADKIISGFGELSFDKLQKMFV